MKLNKKDIETVDKVLNYWKTEGKISEEKEKELKQSLDKKSFNWQSLAYYSFLFAIVSLLIAVISIFADNALLQLIDSLIETSYSTKSISFFLISIVFFWLDTKFNDKVNNKKYSRYIFSFFGAIFLAIAAGLTSYVFNLEENPGIIILLLSILYFIIASFRKQELLWIFGIISFLIAYGAITHDLGKSEYLFIGMNFPMRFTILGLILLAVNPLIKRSNRLKNFIEPTYWSALLVFFISLWFLTIFGNYDSYDKWLEIRQYYLWWYSLILLLASFAAILIGIKKEDSTLKNIGVSFIFLNLYTRYFEYFWDELHKALFFGIIAISFWFIGKKAEKIWDKES